MSRKSLSALNWESNDEATALRVIGFDPHLTAMSLNEVLDDGESQPGST